MKATLTQLQRDKPANTNTKVINDALEDSRQGSLKGRITLNFTNEDIKKDLGVDSATSSYDNINILKLVQTLSQRYKVNIKDSDLTEAKRVSKNGNIQIRFWDMKINSPFYQLCEALKRKGANSKGENVYANFTLTSRRSTLLYLARQAWKKGTLEKLSVDMDGKLTVISKNQAFKRKLTSVMNKENNFVLWTMEESDFRDRFLPQESPSSWA